LAGAQSRLQIKTTKIRFEMREKLGAGLCQCGGGGGGGVFVISIRRLRSEC
jgi:hypothetical protein